MSTEHILLRLQNSLSIISMILHEPETPQPEAKLTSTSNCVYEYLSNPNAEILEARMGHSDVPQRHPTKAREKERITTTNRVQANEIGW